MAMRALSCTSALLLSLGCHSPDVTANEATEVANTHLVESLGINLQSRIVETIDMGDRWRLSYDYSEGGTGGPIIVVVNKRSGKIVHLEVEQ